MRVSYALPPLINTISLVSLKSSSNPRCPPGLLSNKNPKSVTEASHCVKIYVSITLWRPIATFSLSCNTKSFELVKTTSSLPTRVRFVGHDCSYRLGFCDREGLGWCPITVSGHRLEISSQHLKLKPDSKVISKLFSPKNGHYFTFKVEMEAKRL